ncbi:histone acetyltransferase [Fictibacillus macauensis ZFHKF-1]|uniref:Histone acetyltransferase n=1 Tax=Fictibacillus macauensis ZFHKF-1 TaxID=1196324 RepID=I8J1S7_9BACL|nr:GNAT family N-acetyltransferase [Fictibacillus macauensis]EIT85691.1 histone acetyltransferase [Fictibacillus macauensis ZFHKF-1]
MKPEIIVHQVMPHIKAFQAVSQDTPEIMELLVKTAQWLQQKGSTQWGELLEGKDVHGMAQSVERGDVFVFRTEEGKLAGVVMLVQQPSKWDLDLWMKDDPKAIYLHRLAIDRSEAGLGRDILKWATDGIVFHGKSVIRLDCIANNETLNAFYRSEGFIYQGTSKNGFCMYCKEKK